MRGTDRFTLVGAFLAAALTVAASTAGCGSSRPERLTSAAETSGESAETRTTLDHPGPDAPETLAFHIREGAIDNHLFRQGEVAAHVLVTSGEKPRLLFAFPAGNAGAGVWFDAPDSGLGLRVHGNLEPVSRDALRGVKATIEFDEDEVRLTRALLSTIRVIRNFVRDTPVPAAITHEVVAGPPVVWRRTSLDGQRHYELSLEPIEGTRVEVAGESVTLRAGEDGKVRARFVALSDEPPLTPIPIADLLNESALDDPQQRNALAFLTYDEKMLAGSWRFLTYFGRDTLLSVRLLMPALRPRAIEGALGSVIDRLDPEGQVAHEEDIGEQAALRNRAENPPPADLSAPIYDYKMIDDDYMLAPVLAHYVLDTPEGRARAAALFARRTRGGVTYGEALRKNLDYVVRTARPFAEAPEARNLLAIHDGENVGEWRDSQEGLGRGKVPYNVNAILVPAALEAAARLYESSALGADRAKAEEARQMARTWWERAPAFFRVVVPKASASRSVRSYARQLGVPDAQAIAALPETLVFPALSLDARRRPIPVMHSDDGFLLLFGAPAAADLDRIAQQLELPFPAGLMTPVGMVVANAAYAPANVRAIMTPGHYHGAVVWSWQQAMMAAGLRRQIEREDLPAETRAKLQQAESALWDVIVAQREMRTSELWTWEYARDAQQYRMVPFGQGRADQDESNAVQLWSTVYLAVQRP